jgi:mono/diheme cytochrome c family protein
MKRQLSMLIVLLVASGAVLAATAQEPDGKELYNANCKKCHGVIGTPPKTMKAKYEKIATFDADFIAKRTDDSVVKVLIKGKGDNMKSFKSKLSPPEMMAVARYVRELGTRSHPGS